MRDEQFTNGTQDNNDSDLVETKLNNLLVPVEPYLENRIQEFGINGEEQFIQSISIGEKLLDRAGKIDYKFVINKEAEEDKGPKEHPWTEVLKDLKNSFTEVCVLSDLMALLQQRQFLMLDPVQQPQPAYNTSQVIVAKKHGLRSAARILRLGVENMQKGDVGKFHAALANMSSRFKMKKQGSYILGDATYKCCGSEKYCNEDGLFEVVRNNEPFGHPLKVEPDPSVRMLSYLTVSQSDDVENSRFPIPSYWKNIPFPHAQVLGILYSLFTKELFNLLTLDCMGISYHKYALSKALNIHNPRKMDPTQSHNNSDCKAVENLVTVKQMESKTLYIRRNIEPALTQERLHEVSPILNVDELCLQHHLHKRHKMIHEDDSSLQEGSTYSTMMLGVVNNKPMLPSLLNFELLHRQHKIRRAQILEKLDELTRGIKEPNIIVRSGPCSTPHESSLNISLSPVSKIITSAKVFLRVTIGTMACRNSYQIDSSLRGTVYTGPHCHIALSAIKQEIRSFMMLMLRMTCTHNLWGILSTDQQEQDIFAQCPNKQHNLTLTVSEDLHVLALFQGREYQIDRLSGSSVVHKLTLFLNVICEPLKPART